MYYWIYMVQLYIYYQIYIELFQLLFHIKKNVEIS